MQKHNVKVGSTYIVKVSGTLVLRPEGATLQEIMSVTGWMAHSVRGFLSGALGKKMGLAIESIRTPDGARSYRLKTQ
jgi:hypothetical protein